MKGIKLGIAVLLLLAISILGVAYLGSEQTGTFNLGSRNTTAREVRIGIIDDFSGSGAQWGESERAGSELAVKELKSEGINTKLIFEDYRLDAALAATSAQKLVNFDSVDAIFSEYVPASVAVSSVLKDKNIIHIYCAGSVSPLAENYNIKTFMDYAENCKQLALKFKEKGVQKIGVLKAQKEFGELCLNGVKEVYSNVSIEEYAGLGEEKDVRTQIVKLKADGIEALVLPGIEDDLLYSLKAMKELNFIVPLGLSSEENTQRVHNEYSDMLKGSLVFGYKEVSQWFKEKIDLELGKKPTTYEPAALGYIHIKQLARAINACPAKDLNCIKASVLASPSEELLGFRGFVDRKAVFDIELKELQ
ncbi:MAG: ABC transporter substrate-binding protein [Candidatus Diapherotrites archaeon]|nr:ABC transporter substrate-binding protein [Candidatus Diapherotrites archaeon]